MEQVYTGCHTYQDTELGPLSSPRNIFVTSLLLIPVGDSVDDAHNVKRSVLGSIDVL